MEIYGKHRSQLNIDYVANRGEYRYIGTKETDLNLIQI